MSYQITDLSAPSAPWEMTLLEGIVILVRPLLSFDLYAAQARARRVLDELDTGLSACLDAGIVASRDIDLSNDTMRDALYQDFFVKELAVSQIDAFISGIVDHEGNAQAATPDTIRKVMDFPFIAESFYRQLLRHHTELLAAKKDCGTAFSGPSPQAPVPTTVKTADWRDLPAAVESLG